MSLMRVALSCRGCLVVFAFSCLMPLTPTSASDADGSGPAKLESDPRAIRTFSDSIIEPAMRASGVPGAIVTVVNREGLLFAGAYGTADLKAATPVVADETLFNIASIGKTFTAIIATQLIEEGLLDANADVNRYLGDRTVRGGRLTLHQLLGHQARFDRDLSFLFVGPGQETKMATGEINRRLRLLAEPEPLPSYDNRGFGVVGLAAEGVTGKSLGTLFETRIFRPLGMRGAAYGVADGRRNKYARCYVPRGPEAVDPCTLVQFRELIKGAGGVALTAEAAGRYMRMLLGGGELDGVRILSPPAFDKLTDFNTYRVHPALPGLARAFQEFSEPGRLVYGHFGSVPGFSSAMRVYPDRGIGIFMSFMGGQPGSFDATLSNIIRYIGERPVSAEAAAALATLHGFPQILGQALLGNDAAEQDRVSAGDRAATNTAGGAADYGPADAAAPAAVAGRYYGTGPESDNRIVRVLRWGNSIRVVPLTDSSVSVAGQGPFERDGAGLYRHQSGQAVAFLPGDDDAMYLASGLSIATLVRKAWWEVPTWAFLPLFLSLPILLTGVVYLRWMRARDARGTASRAAGGTLLVVTAALLELEYGTWLRIEQGQPFLPWLWSAALYVGIALILMLPLRLLRWRLPPRARRGECGWFVTGHMITLAVAATVFSVAVLWLW